MNVTAQLAWGALALIHLPPAAALFRPALLATLYGVEPGGTACLLLQHRAVLFLGIMLLCAWAALDAAVRPAAAVATAASMIGFLGLYWSAGRPAALRTIAVADLVGLVPLALALWAAFGGPTPQS